MALEREELDEQAAKRPGAASTDRKILTGLAQAAIKAESVTGDPAWDTYLSYIQRAIDVAKQQRAQHVAALASPNMVGDDKIAIARNAIFQMDERIRCLEWTINMPAEIKKVGSVAKEKLAELDLKEAEGETQDAA